jgi:flagellar biosynthesis protein FlhA
VAKRLGLLLSEPVWQESDECAVYSRQVRLAEVRPDSHSVEDLTEAVVGKAAHLLSLADTACLLDELEGRFPIYGQEMRRLDIPVAFVHSVLRLLLKERVSIQDLETILSAIVEGWQVRTSPDAMLERVRDRLSDHICRSFAARPGELLAVTLGEKVEVYLKGKLSESSGELVLHLEPEQAIRFLERLQDTLLSLEEGRPIVLVCGNSIRLGLWRLVERNFPGLGVLSWNEISPDTQVDSLALLEHKF